MNKETKETKQELIFKMTVIIGVIIFVVFIFFGLRYELYSPNEAEKNKNELILFCITAIWIIDMIPMIILMLKQKK